MGKDKGQSGRTVVAQNRRAHYDYHISSSVEAGIVLVGSEVKSLRKGRASINEAYAGDIEGEIFLINAFIPEYEAANRFNHEPKRPRKLLLKKKELKNLLGAITRKGITLVPVSMYFNERGRIKLQLGLAEGKKQIEKRQAEKDREWKRDKERVMKEGGKG
jgi:SsrA-binding protein